MAFLFRSAKKNTTPAELVNTCRQVIPKLENPAQTKIAAEEITKLLQQMKATYFGDAGTSTP